MPGKVRRKQVLAREGSPFATEPGSWGEIGGKRRAGLQPKVGSTPQSARQTLSNTRTPCDLSQLLFLKTKQKDTGGLHTLGKQESPGSAPLFECGKNRKTHHGHHKLTHEQLASATAVSPAPCSTRSTTRRGAMIPDNANKRARSGRKGTTVGGAPSTRKKTVRSGSSSAQQPAGASAHHGAQDPDSAGAIDDSPRPRSTRASKARGRTSFLPPAPPAPVVMAVGPSGAATCPGTHFDPLGKNGQEYLT